VKHDVRYTDLPKQYALLASELDECLKEVLVSGRFIRGRQTEEFESRMADLLGVRHVIGVNSGTDALYLSLRALDIGPGDEVVTVAHTFAATVAVIVHCGAKPVLVDIGNDFNVDVSQIEAAVTPRTKAIIPVHLNGRVCDMDTILNLAEEYGIAVVEDAAQALGAQFNGKAAGSFGNSGCFSLHPVKNLGVAGDGGFVATNEDQLAATVRLLGDHGQKSKEEIVCFGFNSRLDNLHAAIALVKIKHHSDWITQRRLLAARYEEHLRHIPALRLPPAPEFETSNYDVFSSYVVRTEKRTELQQFLLEAGVEVYAHWPIPLHHQPALNLSHWSLPVTERVAQEVLSLPLYPELNEQDQDKVISDIRAFFND
jgi:dTDP-4-amino-4,6-dideoxygalactose transaminase